MIGASPFHVDPHHPHPPCRNTEHNAQLSHSPRKCVIAGFPSTRYIFIGATPVDGIQQAGFSSVEWDAGNFGSGVYFCRLQAGEFTQTRKLLLMR